MKITVDGKTLQLIADVVPEIGVDLKKDTYTFRNYQADQAYKLEIEAYSAGLLEKLEDFLRARYKDLSDRRCGIAANAVRNWIETLSNPEEVVATSIVALDSQMKKFIEATCPNKWLFTFATDEIMLPYAVTRIVYSAPDEDTPAHVNLYLKHRSSIDGEESGYSRRGIRGGERAITWYSGGLKGRTMQDLLKSSGFFIETPTLVEQHRKNYDYFSTLVSRVGALCHARGLALGSGWYGATVRMERDGQPTKVVIDTDLDKPQPTGLFEPNTYWFTSLRAGETGSKRRRLSMEEEEIAENPEDCSLEIPVHTYMRVFSMETHSYLTIYSSYLETYKYNPNLVNQLILPEDTKELVHMLLEHDKRGMEDIISGKASGCIVLSQGVPGVGKTLTAECFSEIMERPLYSVQSSQLGTAIEELEKNLKEILARAVRWNAILLIDEADVYVRSRGGDVTQNAIVGVFLRVLEYYKGILFMTTNRGMEVDDAIVSRTTAVIEYEVPNYTGLLAILRQNAARFGLEVPVSLLELVAKEFNGISGRDARDLIKLVQMTFKSKGIPVTITLFRYCAKFRPMIKKVQANKAE